MNSWKSSGKVYLVAKKYSARLARIRKSIFAVVVFSVLTGN
jgi:hypothetical protein